MTGRRWRAWQRSMRRTHWPPNDERHLGGHSWVKEFDGAKHRLSGLLSPPQRRLLAETMLIDMLDAVAGSGFLPVS